MDDEWTRRVWPPATRDDAARSDAARGDVLRGGMPGGVTAPGDTVPGGVNRGDAVRAGPDEDLPPSARWYGTPAPPPRRMPRWAVRLIVGTLASAAAGTVIGVLVVTVMSRPEGRPTGTVTDPLAGVAYDLPSGWQEAVVAPVTGFTSAAVNDGRVAVMARRGERADPADPRPAVVGLTDVYARLLLHGDKIDVVDDRAVTAGSRRGYTRALRAEYRDTVNQPAFLRVTLLLDAEGASTVLLGLAHPDEPASRADIDALMAGVR